MPSSTARSQTAPLATPKRHRTSNEGCRGSTPLSFIRGRLGDHVYKLYGNKQVVTRVPRFDGYVPTAAQRARRDRMRAATTYARQVYADPAAKALYVATARPLRRQPFRLAISDYLSAQAESLARIQRTRALLDASRLATRRHDCVSDHHPDRLISMQRFEPVSRTRVLAHGHEPEAPPTILHLRTQRDVGLSGKQVVDSLQRSPTGNNERFGQCVWPLRLRVS